MISAGITTRVCTGLVVGVVSVSSHAAAWGWNGQSQLASYYDDNVSLAVAKPIQSWSSSLNLAGSLTRHDDAFTWQVAPRINVVRYGGKPANKAYDREDQMLSSSFLWRSERGSTRIVLDGTQDTTLTSELGLTGFTQANKLHRSGTATVVRTWRASELHSLNVQLAHNVSRYVDAKFTGLVDYDYTSATLGWQYSLNPLSGVFTNVSAGQLRVRDLDGYDKLNMQAVLGYRRFIGEHGQIELSLGPSSVRNDTRTQRGLTYSAEYSYRAEKSTLSVNASRSTTPTGRGWLSVRDLLVLNNHYPWSERWFSSTSLTVSRNHYVLPDADLDTADVNYAALQTGLGWRMTPSFDVVLAASYARQQVAGTDESANRRQAILTLSWRGLDRELN